MNAFLAAALASTGQFCFSAVASGSVVLILPGYIVLCGSLELANRSIISGSVRLVYSVLYSLFLGFGLSYVCATCPGHALTTEQHGQRSVSTHYGTCDSWEYGRECASSLERCLLDAVHLQRAASRRAVVPRHHLSLVLYVRSFVPFELG